MTDPPVILSAQRLAGIRKRLEGITSGPWQWNSYSRVDSVPLLQQDDDAPPYPAKRPAEGCTEEEYWDWYAKREAAYRADCTVCWVPAMVGDTAMDNHKKDAEFIEAARIDVPD